MIVDIIKQVQRDGISIDDIRVSVMTHNELRYIITIYDEGNFSQAAKHLYISQPALSQSIQKIENELGGRLFSRSNAGATPTALCHKLVAEGRAVLEQWDRFMVNVQCMTEDMHASLEVGMCTFLVKNLLPHVLPVFKRRYPYIKLKVVEERTKKLEQRVGRGKAHTDYLLGSAHPDTQHLPLRHVLARPHFYRTTTCS